MPVTLPEDHQTPNPNMQPKPQPVPSPRTWIRKSAKQVAAAAEGWPLQSGLGVAQLELERLRMEQMVVPSWSLPVQVQLLTPPGPVDPLQCSHQFELCLRKKRPFGEGYMNLSATVAPISADQEFMASLERNMQPPAVERQTIREYQFFPTCGGNLSAETAFPATIVASMATPSTAAYASQPIDLSLKLSIY